MHLLRAIRARREAAGSGGAGGHVQADGAGAVVAAPVPGTDGRGGARGTRGHGHVIAGTLAVGVFIGLWQLSGLFLDPIFVSTPARVAKALATLIVSGPLPGAFLRSLLEMIGGFLIATVAGVGVGLLMGRMRLAEKALDPLVAFGNATPSIALLPVMEVWFGFGTAARVAFIMVICTWPILVNTYAGVRAARSLLTDVGKAFGMSGLKQTWSIYLPATVPYIFVGARIALAVGAVGMILGGQEIGQSGLGGLTENFGSYSQTADLVATIVTTTALAMLLFFGLRVLQRRAFPWIAATSAGERA